MNKFYPDRPQFPDMPSDTIKEELLRDRRPTAGELENFVVTPEYWNRAMELYRKDRQWMIEAATKSRDRGVSHRNPPFQVGCAIMGIEPNHPPDDPVLYYSSNFKPFPGETSGEEKRCAERNALDSTRGQAKVIVALITVSRETNTGDTTEIRDTLHPCQDCRNMFRKLLAEGSMREDTIICNINDSAGELKIEERTLKDLLTSYARDIDARGQK